MFGHTGPNRPSHSKQLNLLSAQLPLEMLRSSGDELAGHGALAVVLLVGDIAAADRV